jgi:AcrR family transcriptional regulator
MSAAAARPYGGATLEARRADQRERLLLAARDAFAANGYAATSIEDIVTRARVSRSSFYEFFAGKEACLLAVFAFGASRFRDALLEAASRELEPVDRIRAEILALTQACERDPAMARVLLIEIVGATPAAERVRSAARLIACQVIEDQLAGYDAWRRRPALERHLAALATMAAIGEPLSQLVAAEGERDWEAIVEPITAYVARALMAA